VCPPNRGERSTRMALAQREDFCHWQPYAPTSRGLVSRTSSCGQGPYRLFAPISLVALEKLPSADGISLVIYLLYGLYTRYVMHCDSQESKKLDRKKLKFRMHKKRVWWVDYARTRSQECEPHPNWHV